MILLLGSVGCARGGPPPETPWVPETAPDLGAIVARVGSVPIYAREVEAELARSQGTAREATDELIVLHLLAEQAHRKNTFRPDWFDPELRSALAERLIERDLWPQIQRESIPDKDLRAIYQNAIISFVHPRLVDAGFLIVFTGPYMKPKPRAERAQTAKALAAVGVLLAEKVQKGIVKHLIARVAASQSINLEISNITFDQQGDLTEALRKLPMVKGVQERPFANKVAVWYSLGAAILPVAVHFPAAGS